MNAAAEKPAQCVCCGAPIGAEDIFCAVCRHPAGSARLPSVFQFSLDSLFLLMTLVAVCLAVFVALPPLGVAVIALVAPTLLRTTVLCHRLHLENEGMAWLKKTAAFCSSLFVTLLATFMAASVGIIALWIGVASLQGLEAISPQTFTETVVGLILGTTSVVGIIACLFTFLIVYWWTLPPSRQPGG